MPTKRPKLPKPAAPVRAWIPCAGGNPLEVIRACNNRIRFLVDLLPEKRHSGCRPVLILDPRTHRAVPLKKAKKPVVRRKRNG